MRVGDCVNFVSHAWVTDRDYPNPGVVHEIHERPGLNPNSTITVATILWSNGTLTHEHACYLQVINENR